MCRDSGPYFTRELGKLLYQSYKKQSGLVSFFDLSEAEAGIRVWNSLDRDIVSITRNPFADHYQRLANEDKDFDRVLESLFSEFNFEYFVRVCIETSEKILEKNHQRHAGQDFGFSGG